MDKHINIITLNQLLSPGTPTKGGLELWVREISRLIQDMGYKSIIYQNSFTNDYWEDEFEGAKVQAYPHGGGRPPQHIYNQMGPNVLYAWWGAALEYPIPGVVVSHGVHFNSPADSGSGFDGVRPWMKKAIEKNKFTVFVDSSEMNLWRAVYPSLTVPKSTFIVNFADVDRFKPVHRKPDNKVRILYPRRIDEPRGIGVMRNIVPKLIRDYSFVYFDFVVDQNHMEKYNELVQWSKQFGNRVTVDTKMYTEIHEAYYNCDIVAAPTLYSEGSSLTVVEAICSGKPVVTSNVGGLPDVAIDRWNALVTDPKEDLFEQSLRSLIEDEGLRQILGRNGAQMASAFSLDRWRTSWSEIISRYY